MSYDKKLDDLCTNVVDFHRPAWSHTVYYTHYRYNDCLEQVISRALSHGVHKMIICSNTLEDAQQAIIVAESLPGVLYCAVGVHPHQAKVLYVCSV